MDLRVTSWNVRHLNLQKVQNAFAGALIGRVVLDADMLVAQEVTDPQAVTAIRDAVNKWLANLQPPSQVRYEARTSPLDAPQGIPGGDRYAVFYKSAGGPGITYVGEGFPARCNAPGFNNSPFTPRNPYYYSFTVGANNTQLTVLTFHAPPPGGNQPAVRKNVSALGTLSEVTTAPAALVLGDFNTEATIRRPAFKPLTDANFTMQINANTSLNACLGTWLNDITQYESQPYDNILSKNLPLSATPGGRGALPLPYYLLQTNQNNTLFVPYGNPPQQLQYVSDALWVYRSIVSDHLPVVCTFNV